MLNANTFFAGKARSIDFESGSIGNASIGVVKAGEYSIGTAQAQEMTIISGAVKVMLPGANEWHVFMPGETFFVPAHSEFTFQTAESTSYFCRYK